MMLTHQLRRLPTAAIVLVVVGAATVAIGGLVGVVDGGSLRAGLQRAAGDPLGLAVGVLGFGLAFVLRANAWTRTMPGLSNRQAVAGIHLALGGNHVLPLRLGEPLRIVSVVRRAGVDPGDATASTVALRSADLLSLLALGTLAVPGLVAPSLGGVGLALTVVLGLVAAIAVRVMVRRARRRGGIRVPDATVVLLTTLAWLGEAVLVWQVLRWFDIAVTPAQVMGVLAAAVAAQLVAIAPGGLGTYEAAAAAALVAVGADPGVAFAAALALHGIKTVYSLVAGVVALMVPSPPLWGRLRLPRALPARPSPQMPADPGAPIVLFLPAHNEAPRVAQVIGRAPSSIGSHPVEVVVVDDGSADDTVAVAEAAGATVIEHTVNRGLGAAVRTGFEHGVETGAAAVVFCDADGEYDPGELDQVVAPILAGAADYVAGSRFAGRIQHMRPHRRLGNIVLSRWVRWIVRRPVTDGQTGYRALSPTAAAAVDLPHDYNYAQVLTIDLIARGFVYAEVPITYRFRESGRSFVRLSRYLRRVVPTVWRQLNPPAVTSRA
ncbi:lysylphosphatidylglycerol synthase domain-containing protein [Euzebya tangerina]|uniref:lysylphosphatidylglycerol synthase domain-containing protein n=1 Tax=Euzebya tangerina TaxID=591198 RepID=UPI000E318551|nr:lysylphosphatidylglycerol synthase domain-containing protein [Euzebya tangerina]